MAPLLAKRSTGPESTAAMITRERSSACSSGVVVAAPSVRRLALDAARVVGDDRAVGKHPARVPNPAAPMGDPISTRGASPAPPRRMS